jgi:hypothetical protein
MAEKAVRVGDEDGEEGGEGPDHEGGQEVRQEGRYGTLPGPVAEETVRVGDEDGEEGGEGPNHEGGQEVRQQGRQVGEGMTRASRRVQRHLPATGTQFSFSILDERAASPPPPPHVVQQKRPLREYIGRSLHFFAVSPSLFWAQPPPPPLPITAPSLQYLSPNLQSLPMQADGRVPVTEVTETTGDAVKNG